MRFSLLYFHSGINKHFFGFTLESHRRDGERPQFMFVGQK